MQKEIGNKYNFRRKNSGLKLHKKQEGKLVSSPDETGEDFVKIFSFSLLS